MYYCFYDYCDNLKTYLVYTSGNLAYARRLLENYLNKGPMISLLCTISSPNIEGIYEATEEYNFDLIYEADDKPIGAPPF